MIGNFYEKKIKCVYFTLLSVLLVCLAVVLLTGCNTGLVSSSVETTTTTICKDGTPKTVTVENNVLAMRGTVLVNTEVDKANINWGDVQINVGGLSTAGDAASINALGSAISNGIMAYFTGGGSEAVKAAVMGTLMATQPSASTNAPAMK